MLPLLFPTFCFYDIVKVRPNIILAEKLKELFYTSVLLPNWDKTTTNVNFAECPFYFLNKHFNYVTVDFSFSFVLLKK